MLTKIATGKRGEDLAVSYLRKQGYKILEKNYRIKLGEIDIIAEDKDRICFIEVRSKNSQNFCSVEETITKHKQMQVTKAALAYIKKYKLKDRSCRFDVVCIEDVDGSNPDIKLIKNAFELDERYGY